MVTPHEAYLPWSLVDAEGIWHTCCGYGVEVCGHSAKGIASAAKQCFGALGESISQVETFTFNTPVSLSSFNLIDSYVTSSRTP
jgi:hypothetical protein